MAQLFAGTSELYRMSAKCSYSTKALIHASKPSYHVSNLAKATKYKVFCCSVQMFSCFFTMTVNHGK